MSRWMQIRVRVEPVYKKSFAKDFPKLYRVVTGLDNSLIDRNPTFLDLVPLVVRLSHEKPWSLACPRPLATTAPRSFSCTGKSPRPLAAGSWARPRSCSTSWRTTSRPLRRSWAERAALPRLRPQRRRLPCRGSQFDRPRDDSDNDHEGRAIRPPQKRPPANSFSKPLIAQPTKRRSSRGPVKPTE